jgi:hypothetical protein
MADPTKTEEKLTVSLRLEAARAKRIVPPTKLRKRHITSASEGFTETKTRLLVCIMHTGDSTYFKEITSNHTLANVKASPYAASHYELTQGRLKRFKTLA